MIDPAAGAVLSFGLAAPPHSCSATWPRPRLVPRHRPREATLARALDPDGALLFGWRGSATAVDTPALEELLLRVSRLVDDHPEVAVTLWSRSSSHPHGARRCSAPPSGSHPARPRRLGPRTLPGLLSDARGHMAIAGRKLPEWQLWDWGDHRLRRWGGGCARPQGTTSATTTAWKFFTDPLFECPPAELQDPVFRP